MDRVAFLLGSGRFHKKPRTLSLGCLSVDQKKSYTITFYSVGVTIKTYYEKTCVNDNAVFYTVKEKTWLQS